MVLVSILDYEEKAAESMPKSAWDYYQRGGGDEHTLRINKVAYEQFRIRPRVLVDVAKRDTKCNVLGINLDFPVAIAPTALHKLAATDGEKATAKAAGKCNTIYTMSTYSTTTIEEVATAAPNTNKWFQLHIFEDHELTTSFVRRAEDAGYKAIVVTVDMPVLSLRRIDIKNNFQLPNNLQYVNFTSDKSFLHRSGGSVTEYMICEQNSPSVNWKHIQWLVGFTKLPVILKGILTHEDATLALNSGCKGIIVSNHGGRQLDSVPATIEALPEIVAAVGSKLVVMIDGGIRSGTDVFKALALGAKIVFIGRPVLYGLAVNGERGIEDVLTILKNELDIAMALAGVTKLSQINQNFLKHESSYKLSKL